MRLVFWFLNLWAFIIIVYSYAVADGSISPDKPPPLAVGDWGDESTSNFVDNGLASSPFVASISDDEFNSNYLDPNHTSDHSDASQVDATNLSIDTSDACSSPYKQITNKRIRRWDCGPFVRPFCCPPPGFTHEKPKNQQAPGSTNQPELPSRNQQESDSLDTTPTPVYNPLDNKEAFPINLNEEICPADIFSMSLTPTCDSGDPQQATPQRGQDVYYTLDDCYPFIPLFGCWWKPSNTWCCQAVRMDKRKSRIWKRPYYYGTYCIRWDQSLPRSDWLNPQPATPILPGPF